MAYVDYEFYKTLYGDKAIQEADFNRLSWDACRKMDIATTGVDNVRKLQVAFPTDTYDAEAVKRCAVELINHSYKIEQAEAVANSAKGYVTREDGTLQGKVVSSVSAGNESISYSTNGSSGAATAIDKAVADEAERERQYRNIIEKYLSGVLDANGVSLLYLGEYPYRLE